MQQGSVGKLRIAIDGPAGAGKSTVAREIARRLGIFYVDTGAMYRAAAWLALHRRMPLSEEPVIVDLLRTGTLQFQPGLNGSMDVYWGDRRITDDLRSPEVSNTVSALSAKAAIREVLTEWQRAVGAKYSVVMDGRDIGTVVLPDAEVKVFLTADLSARAERRATEMQQQGFDASVVELAQAIEARDAQDRNRAVAPLRQAPDAHHIDSTDLGIDEVVEQILRLVPRGR